MEKSRYAEWQASLMDDTKQRIFKTISGLLDESGKELTYSELERLNLCWDIIRDMAKVQAAESSGEGGSSM